MKLSINFPVLIFALAFQLIASTLAAQSKTSKRIEIPLKNFNTEFLPFKFDSITLEENIYINYYSGKSPIKIDNCVFLNPGMELEKSNPNLPLALKYYTDVFEYAYIDRYGIPFVNKILKKDLSEYFQPFYIKQHEVTNAEYREFVYWVRDSIARRMLAEVYPEEFLIEQYDEEGAPLPESECPLNWNKELEYWNKKYLPYLEKMYYPDNERYYRRKEFDVRRFRYDYRVFDVKAHAKAVKNQTKTDSKINQNNFYIRDIVNIYPDTLSWNDQFPNKATELLKNLYFWHPAFDNHPVVGVSFDQAQAFCDWKTKQLNKLYSKNKLKIEVQLPNEYEWEYAVENSYSMSKTYLERLYNKDHNRGLALLLKPFYDVNYLINNEKKDLGLKNAEDSADHNFKKIMYNIILQETGESKKIVEQLSALGLFAYPKKLNSTEISGLNNNVSEWINETYIGTNTIPNRPKNYFFMLEPAISKLLVLDNSANSSSYRLKLVRGANWFDDYNTVFLKNNPEGTKAKTFAAYDSSYATLGFRYVVKIK